MARKNDWVERFGAKRRASDRKLLADLERQIALEDKVTDEERRRIAQAFGRPLSS